MKQVYIVMNDDYREKPLMAFQERNDAVKTACAIHECAADEASKHIKAVPIMCEAPEKVDLTDVQTVIDMTIKACESANTMASKYLCQLDGDA